MFTYHCANVYSYMWLKQLGTYIGLECADGSGDEGMCVLVVVKANVCGIGCSAAW